MHLSVVPPDELSRGPSHEPPYEEKVSSEASHEPLHEPSDEHFSSHEGSHEDSEKGTQFCIFYIVTFPVWYFLHCYLPKFGPVYIVT